MNNLPDQLRTMADAIKTGRSVARTNVAALVHEAATRFEILQTYAKELEAENAWLLEKLWRFIQESEHGGGTIDEKSSQGIRMALDALFEQPADDEGGSVMLEFKKHPFNSRTWEFFKNGEHLGDISTRRTGKYRIASCHLDEMDGNALREIADKLDELNRELPMTSFYSPCCCHQYRRKWSGRAPRDRDSPSIIRQQMTTGGQWVCRNCGRHEPKQRKQ